MPCAPCRDRSSPFGIDAFSAEAFLKEHESPGVEADAWWAGLLHVFGGGHGDADLPGRLGFDAHWLCCNAVAT